jgi:D-tyrosyl-tRNA(Tyr) deacylase
MIGLLQRVSEGRVMVDGEVVGEVGPGLVVLIAVEPADTDVQADRLVDRILGYRVFDDDQGRMNRSLRETGGGVLLVPQFTLAADTARGTRASFTGAAEPALGRRLFDHVVRRARAELGDRVATGRFGARMQVSLTNDGPVTFWLQAAAAPARG